MIFALCKRTVFITPPGDDNIVVGTYTYMYFAVYNIIMRTVLNYCPIASPPHYYRFFIDSLTLTEHKMAGTLNNIGDTQKNRI